jgi:hypothetical protein
MCIGNNKKRFFEILIFFFFLLQIVSCENNKNDKKSFSLNYIFQKGFTENKSFIIYKDNQLFSTLDNLNNRSILEIHFDRKNADSILFAEKIDNIYRVIRLNYVTNEEQILYDFEQDIYRFRSFTEDYFFWCEKCENSREPHILYSYNSKTKEIKKLYEVEDILDKWGERYESRYITSVQAYNDTVYFYVNGGFVGDSGSYVINLLTGNIQKNEIDIGFSTPSRYKNKIITEGSTVTQNENMKSFTSNGKSCVITDLTTFEEIKCTFKKRYERMAGPLILLSDDYFLVPLCVSPIKDSLQNGLFGNNWTVCYSVFDIGKNKPVFNGITTETDLMRLVDAVFYSK